jgi:DNA invertase Pin-like site-specific DNA recombinase
LGLKGDWFYDAAVSGADPIDAREGFKALLARIDGNGVCTVLIDEPSRFARDLITQELGVTLMIQRGVKVICANGDDLTVDASVRWRVLAAGEGSACRQTRVRTGEEAC